MSSDDGRSDWLLLILASPSGAGKTTLKNRLVEEFSDLRFSISHTTRRARAHEQHGREYHFVERVQFEAMIEQSAFAEWADVFGNLYGTSMFEIERSRSTHRGVIFDLDYQGARQMIASVPEAVTVFILPPSFEELERRLRGRGDEGEESIQRRLAKARREIEQYAFFDYVIINDDVDAAYERLRAVVLAERTKRRRVAPMAERLLRHGSVRGAS